MVVPTYNERENVGALIEGILAGGPEIDVCVADDGSPDGTAQAVRESMARHPGRVDLLERHVKGGRGAAVIAAFRKGLGDPRYRYLFEMDADFSHHPRDLPKFLEKLRSCDMVIGSRYVEGGGTSEWGLLRPLLSWLANKYISLVARIPVRDTTSGYRGYRRAVTASRSRATSCTARWPTRPGSTASAWARCPSTSATGGVPTPSSPWRRSTWRW